MVKLSPTFIEGKKVVRLSDLPYSQSSQLTSWLSESGIMKMNFGGLVMEDCVDYKDYEYWLHTYVMYKEFYDKDL